MCNLHSTAKQQLNEVANKEETSITLQTTANVLQTIGMRFGWFGYVSLYSIVINTLQKCK